MAIGELCTREVVYVALNDSAAEAAKLMRENHVGSLVVLDPPEAGGKPAGMVTDRDLVVGIMALGLDARDVPVEAVMRPGVACVSEEDGVGRAIAVMKAEGVRRLPVVDRSGALVGLLAADDLLELLAEEMSGMAAVVSREFKRERAERSLAAA